MQRNDLVFLALITALAAIASAPPLPASGARWVVADAAPHVRSEPMQELAFQVSLGSIP